MLDIDTHEEVSVNEVGVGYLYSPALMSGYYGDEEATNHNLVKDENGVVWYNTEDLIRVNENGELFLEGRIRRIALTIDSKGNPTKIIPERTKKCISMIKEINNCEVITVPNERVVNTAIAFVTLNQGQLPTEDLRKKIMLHCQTNIPEYMVPSEIIYLDEIPVNSNKKPDLIGLEKIYFEGISSLPIKKKKK